MRRLSALRLATSRLACCCFASQLPLFGRAHCRESVSPRSGRIGDVLLPRGLAAELGMAEVTKAVGAVLGPVRWPSIGETTLWTM